MNYIGSKNKLSGFLRETITEVAGQNLQDKIFCDLFAGTGIVGRRFKGLVQQVISNDIEYYSYVLIRNYIGNVKKLNYQAHFDLLNNNPLIETGFIYQNYCLGSGSGRQYFSDENGKRIDSWRQQIERWENEKEIDDDLYFFLLASLLESADKVANTASVYGAFLKQLKKSARQTIVLRPAEFDLDTSPHQVFNEDSNQLIQKISGDILYLDPPYNSRQYGANYHLLNTIATYRSFEPQGKTGLPAYYRSAYCQKKTVLKQFEDLLKQADFKYIFLSYNNEGLMRQDEVRQIMTKFGHYQRVEQAYQRFKADTDEMRNHKAKNTLEYIHILEKSS